MRSHARIDERSLAMARAIVSRVDHDPERRGLDVARGNLRRWRNNSDTHALREWQAILDEGWPSARATLLDESEEGCRLRQSSPFCGILSPQERWDIYQEFHEED